ncbi:hypothetical protein [Bradyrhizobium cenepequi]|uniref:hypothetical protein n=1 Tax=Bradyrhizobium cenepequi TaxID=2821403 RepID=UPI001CE2DECE|nr:hypothetical protein [Bradyrhizobium cenepequi]MCA6111558.1 hypothetical protein [Bradyrhizobium cenepequi]
MTYRFTSPDMTADERYSLYESWLLSKGFQELARGVHETLEQALIFSEMLKYQPAQTTWGDFQKHVQQLEHRAGRLPFPALLAEVNGRNSAKVSFREISRTLKFSRTVVSYRE